MATNRGSALRSVAPTVPTYARTTAPTIGGRTEAVAVGATRPEPGPAAQAAAAGPASSSAAAPTSSTAHPAGSPNLASAWCRRAGPALAALPSARSSRPVALVGPAAPLVTPPSPPTRGSIASADGCPWAIPGAVRRQHSPPRSSAWGAGSTASLQPVVSSKEFPSLQDALQQTSKKAPARQPTTVASTVVPVRQVATSKLKQSAAPGAHDHDHDEIGAASTASPQVSWQKPQKPSSPYMGPAAHRDLHMHPESGSIPDSRYFGGERRRLAGDRTDDAQAAGAASASPRAPAGSRHQWSGSTASAAAPAGPSGPISRLPRGVGPAASPGRSYGGHRKRMIVGPTLKQKLMDVVQPSDVSGARTLQWLLDDVPSIIQATAFELIRPPRPGRAYGWWCSSRNEMVLQEGAYARIIRAFEFTIGVESEARVSRKCELPGFREAYTPYADRLSGDGLVEPLQLAQSLLVFIAMTLASYVDTRKPRASNPEMSEHPSNVKYDPKRAYGHLYRDEHCLAVVEEILLGCSDHHHHGDLIALLKSFRARVDVEYKIADEWNSKPRPNWK